MMRWVSDKLKGDHAEITKGIGRMVKSHRKGRGLTQTDLSLMSGVSQSTICKLERGQLTDIGAITLAKIGVAFGLAISPWWLER